MESNHPTWQEHFALTICPASALASTLASTALGVAVIYAPATTDATETVFLVIESRARALLAECERRLSTAKLPPLASLLIAFKADVPTDATPESIHASCREQVIFAGELRRALRPAMR